MSARDRTRIRLERRAPGEDLWGPRALQRQLQLRDVDPPKPRCVVGESFTLRVSETRRIRGTADPTPNVPLLKRMNRNPQDLHPSYPKRLKLFEPRARTSQDREGTPRPVTVAKDARALLFCGSPLRVFSRLPEPRLRASVDAWLEQEVE